MKAFFAKHGLLFVVFVTGACVLVVEIVATRILSPYFGNTIFTVSSVITVILAALSIGYYAGGRLADARPSRVWFFSLIASGGLALLLLQALANVALPALGKALPITTGPLVSSLAFFFLPALIMGMLSPYAIKLQMASAPEQGIGAVSGRVFFWSTLGSIAGSLSAGFLFIPYVGVSRIMLWDGIILFALGLIPLMVMRIKKSHLIRAVLAFFLVFESVLFSSGPTQAFQVYPGTPVYSRDGVYEKLAIYDGDFKGRPARFFQQDHSCSSAMFLDSNDPVDLVYDYTKYYALYAAFHPDVKSVLVLGGGAYSVPKALLKDLPNAQVDVAEIEPLLFDLGKKFFSVPDDPRLLNFTQDGRRFLQEADASSYGLIFSDVYASLYSVPAQFTTKEFFTIAKSRLEPNGLFIANLVGDLSRQEPSFIFSEIKTFQAIFTNSRVFAVDSPGAMHMQNIMLVGRNGDAPLDPREASLAKSPNPLIRSLKDKEIDLSRFDLSRAAVLTDDFSPVEYLVAKGIERNQKNAQALLSGKEMMATIGQIERNGIGFLRAELAAISSDVQVQGDNTIVRINPDKTERIVLAAESDPAAAAIMLEVVRDIFFFKKAEVGIDIVFFGQQDGPAQFVQHLKDVYPKSKPVGGVVLGDACGFPLKFLKESSSVKTDGRLTDAFWQIAQKVNSNLFVNQTGREVLGAQTILTNAGIPSFLISASANPDDAFGSGSALCDAASLQSVARAIASYMSALR